MDELITIVIPVYNAKSTIGNCLLSVINQIYKNIEVIVIIDGSKDDSLNIVNSYALKDPRIKVINRDNKGVLYTRIEGVKKALGSYILFVDSDDTLANDAILKLYTNIYNTKADFVKGNFDKIFKNKVIQSKKIVNENMVFSKNEYEPFIYDLLFNDIFLNSMWNTLFRKNLFDDVIYNFSLIYGEDLDTMLKLIDKANSISIINDITYHYFINMNGITLSNNINKIKNKTKDIKKVYQEMYNYTDIYNIKDKNKYYLMSNKKLLINLTFSFLDLVVYSKDKKDTILFIKAILNDITFKNIKINNSYNFIYKVAFNLVKKNKINLLYYYGKLIYKNILKIRGRY